jgi:hypothetical protein
LSGVKIKIMSEEGEIESRRILLETVFGGVPSGWSFDDYKVTSPSAKSYNAVAWAIGEEEKGRIWSPEPFDQFYWPHVLSTEETMENHIGLFRLYGYSLTEDGSCESGFEKVAIYCKAGIPTHASRQLSTGWWTSKLGKNHDINHRELGCLEGEVYGSVYQILKRET